MEANTLIKCIEHCVVIFELCSMGPINVMKLKAYERNIQSTLIPQSTHTTTNTTSNTHTNTHYPYI